MNRIVWFLKIVFLGTLGVVFHKVKNKIFGSILNVMIVLIRVMVTNKEKDILSSLW